VPDMPASCSDVLQGLWVKKKSERRRRRRRRKRRRRRRILFGIWQIPMTLKARVNS
jgi:hypothetical protein